MPATGYTHYPGSAESGIYAPIWNPVSRRIEYHSQDPRRYTVPIATQRPVDVGSQVIPGILTAQQMEAGQSDTGIAPISFPRSGRVAKETETLFGDIDALRDRVNDTLGNFKSAYGDFLPAAKAATDQENTVLGRAYTGELAGEQATNRSALLKALEDVGSRRIIEDVRPLIARGRLAGVPSSDLDRAALNIAAGIRTQAALTAAEQQRRDLEQLINWQTLLRGARAAAGRQYLGDVLMPQQVNANALMSVLNALEPTARLDLLNRISGVVAPGGYVGETLSGLQSARLQDLSRIQGYDQMAQDWNKLMLTLPAQYEAARNQLVAGQPNVRNADLARYYAVGQGGRRV